MIFPIQKLYYIRFNEQARLIKNLLWAVLCKNFLQKYINKRDTVLDLGAGYCEFINNINCKAKIAVDIDPYVKNFAKEDVSVFVNNAIDLKEIASDSIDVVFISELFEHLNDKNELLKSIGEILRVLKINGILLIICPNIKYLASHYWDFVDHILPLSHTSLSEALQLSGFKIEKIIPRFLPYTTKNILPKSPLLLKIYLNMPMLWPIFGRQMFIVARKSP
jgi:SAM-dependent methyltransferase